MNQFYSFPRLQRAMLNDALRVAWPALFASLALLGITVLVCLNKGDPGDANTDVPMSQRLFAIYLGIAGLGLTSQSFQDMHHPLERYRYLLLPISNFERYLGRYLLTGPLFVLYVLVAFTIADWAGNFVSDLLLNVRHPRFDQFSENTGRIICVYLCVHALMFTGAICFRSHALIKTALTGLVVGLGSAAVVYVSMRIFYFDAFSWTRFEAVKNVSIMLQPMFTARWMNTSVIVAFVLWVLYVAYRCLKGHEVQE